MAEEPVGRVFFSSIRRSLEVEDEIELTSVGVDIGSSTSHLVFSTIVLERLDNRYIVTHREVLYESAVLLTPYADDTTIDAHALGRFIDRQYADARLEPKAIDTGALILTGLAVRRRNARAIGELFAAQTGKFVAVSAGDGLEATLSAFGSGAAARSIRENRRVMNVDIGGGTSKIAICANGAVTDMTVIDVGARLIVTDAAGRVTRIEEAGRRFAEEAGVRIEIGAIPDDAGLKRIAGRMADRLFEAMGGRPLSKRSAALLRLPPLQDRDAPDVLTFSGGVSEYIYSRERSRFGDLGAELAAAIRQRTGQWSPLLAPSAEGIRATVIGASQYTVQVSGSTIFVQPHQTLPLRNLPAVRPHFPWDDVLDADAIAGAVRSALQRFDLQGGEQPVALCYEWAGSATYHRLDAFCRGVLAGLVAVLEHGHPVVLVGQGDFGGLVGIHIHETSAGRNPIVSVDGIILKEFDFVDIGALMDSSGAVPVVIKSLIFPVPSAPDAGAGQDPRRDPILFP